MDVQEVTAITGAGELPAWVGKGVTSPSPELLFSLPTALTLLLALLSLSPVGVVPALPADVLSIFLAFGVRQVGTCQTTPVKLFSWKGLRSHLRHGFPVRSRARKPALMAPRLAFGPSLCVAAGASPETRPVLSIVPSSLSNESASATADHPFASKVAAEWAGSRMTCAREG